MIVSAQQTASHSVISLSVCRCANQVPIEINKTKRLLEDIAFGKNVKLALKLKIESVSNLSECHGFTCSQWFKLNAHRGLMISFEFTVNLLLLLTYYRLYKLGMYDIQTRY